MDNVIVIDNLSYKCGGKVIFNNLSFSLKKGSFTTILGNNGSGKTSLVRLLSGLERYSGSIYITNVLLEKKTRNTILSKIGFVFEDVDTILFSERVIDNLVFHLQCLNYSNDYIIHRVNEISKYLGIEYLLNRCCSDLSGSEKQLVCLACALITGPELLIFDNAFSMIADKRKKDLFIFLARINRDIGVTILNITNDIEDSVYGDHILILDNGSVLTLKPHGGVANGWFIDTAETRRQGVFYRADNSDALSDIPIESDDTNQILYTVSLK